MKMAKTNKNSKCEDISYLFEVASSNYLRDYAYCHGNKIYDFMNHYQVGHSAYGSMMDAAAKGKGVIAHRLYGHHLVFDFPLNDPKNIPAFLEHEFSDLFTKQGLPILPNEILEDTGLLKYCNSLTKNWNFVNGFDILSGTVALYGGKRDFKDYFLREKSVDTIGDIAKTVGVGVLEVAIAMSTANPFLLLGGVLSLTSGIRGVFNSGARFYFNQRSEMLSVRFETQSLSYSKLEQVISLDYGLRSLSMGNQLQQLSLDNFLGSI